MIIAGVKLVLGCWYTPQQADELLLCASHASLFFVPYNVEGHGVHGPWLHGVSVAGSVSVQPPLKGR